MKNPFLFLLITSLLTIAIPTMSTAGLRTGNYKTANIITANTTANSSSQNYSSVEDELSGVVTGNFYEPENNSLAQGVVTGNFHTSREESPHLATLASGVVTGNFHTLCSSSKNIEVNAWYTSADESFRWQIRKDSSEIVDFLFETLDLEHRLFVITVDLE